MEKPKVRFIYAYPLDVSRRNLAEERGIDYPSVEKIIETKDNWERLWESFEKENSVINLIQEITKNTPDRSLECFVVGGMMSSMSAPFIVTTLRRGADRSDEDFIDTMIHELLHIFLSKKKSYFSFLGNKYEAETKLTQNHIPIYAMLEKIYEEVFKSKPLDYSRNDIPVDYQKAVDIVKKEGYKNILEDYYQNI
ncbi:MAG: hypothetical protein H6743_04865 [Rickettsiaceae bacterium]|nr:hypothetical protein [Rickettsiaceae bacterium]USN94509.1 MAG: hypothetical protein H6791_01965 [Candidatus Nomurabacteria bacterium]